MAPGREPGRSGVRQGLTGRMRRIRVRSALATAAAGAAVVTLLAGCGSPGALAAPASSDQLAWVATHAFESQPGATLTPVDLFDHEVEPAVMTASEPAAMASAPGNRLLVANKGDDTLTVLDDATGAVESTIRVGLEPDAVAVDASADRGRGMALVADFGADDVTPVDLGTSRAGPPVAVGSEPTAVAIGTGADGAVALVTDFGSDAVTPVALSTMTAGPSIAVGSEPDAVAVLPPGSGRSGTKSAVGGDLAIVADFGSDSLTPIGLTTLRAGTSIPIGGDPTAIAVTPGGTAWISAGRFLVPVFGSTERTGTPISLPYVAEALALEGTTTAWVGLEDGELLPVALPSGPVGKPIVVGGRPSAVIIAP